VVVKNKDSLQAVDKIVLPMTAEALVMAALRLVAVEHSLVTVLVVVAASEVTIVKVVKYILILKIMTHREYSTG
jgi:hypothetical protein